ncbi:hypothetical protein [Chitinimonas sp. BJYL2]|uniref:hypothetical protein n=1 Tax=Chitinimonas sp. BJYL2 TaxID=2976696 RepID=UPI0022B542C7|nr:hypothetical protein [Chitinimonas sp. BJYL2]
MRKLLTFITLALIALIGRTENTQQAAEAPTVWLLIAQDHYIFNGKIIKGKSGLVAALKSFPHKDKIALGYTEFTNKTNNFKAIEAMAADAKDAMFEVGIQRAGEVKNEIF